MRKLTWMFLVPAAVLSVACGRSSSPAIDDALKNDLALASQAQPYNAQQFVSPVEGGYAQQYAPRAIQTAARQPVARRTSTARRSSGSSSGGGSYPAPAPTTTVKHTGRDAAIGAAAGTVIGVVTSRDKVKGGVVGAAAGALRNGSEFLQFPG